MNVDPAMAMEVATLKRQRALQLAIESGESNIQKFYHEKTIFISGGTGFLGKQMIDKLLRYFIAPETVMSTPGYPSLPLLAGGICEAIPNEWPVLLRYIDGKASKCGLSRSCPTIKKIYLIVRAKKNKLPSERIVEITSEPLYDELRKVYPKFFEKLAIMEGDIQSLNLGLSEKDIQIFTNEVNIVFHLAATTRFDELIKSAVLINVRATRELLGLAQKCISLDAFVHVSTAFSNCNLSTIEEKFYPTPIPYNTMIDLVENTDEDLLNRITAKLIENWPNTYTFTKAIAEDAVRNMGANMPVTIVRPAIVVCTHNEPSPGWLDMSSVYGPSGVIAGSGMGVMHSFLADLKKRVDIVPADFVNNATIAASHKVAMDFKNGEREIKIYQYTSGNRNPLHWNDIVTLCNENCRWMISPQAIWYCFNYVQSNKFLHILLTLLFHTIPAYVVDAILLFAGKKPMLRKFYGKVNKQTEVLSHFCLHEWDFDDKNTKNLFDNLSVIDKEIFQFDITTVSWKEYVQFWYMGIRRYIVKDGLKNTDLGAKKQFYFRIGHYLIISFYCYVFWYISNTMFKGLSYLLF